jgi:hypothetical protein
MKVYLVWEVSYSTFLPQQRLKGIYSSEEKAKKATEYLNVNNLSPLEEDDYGPYGGIEYLYYENEVLD